MRVIFLGTPEFAVPSLEAVLNAGHEVIAVVSQPDRAKDRKGNLLETDVKKFALKNALKLYQFEKISRDGIETLKALEPDIMVTAAYGQILSKEVLAIPKYGVINVHASLLPKYRGSAPIQWAVINGERETGVTVMQTEEGLDTGDILGVKKTDIPYDFTAGEMFDRLKIIGARLLVETMALIEKGKVIKIPQNHTDSTKCRLITGETARIDFSLSSEAIHNLIRGLNPKPVAYTTLDGVKFKIYTAQPDSGARPLKPENGEVIRADESGIYIACGSGVLRLSEVQLESKKRLKVEEFIKGYKLTCGTVLGREKE